MFDAAGTPSSCCPSPPRSVLYWLRLVLLLWLFPIQPVQAEAPLLDNLPSDPLGRFTRYLVEKSEPLSLLDVRALNERGSFISASNEVPKFGIGARPVWLHLPVNNAESLTARRRLQIEISWLDRIDVYQLHEDKLVAQWRAGDADAGQQHPKAGLGYLFDLDLPPGHNDIYLRIETPDPLVAPVRLLDTSQAEAMQSQYDHAYGLFYGCLLALIAYNAMLYVGLRERGYFDYTLYLASFALLHLAYTGHAYAWLWPGQATFQQYVIPLAMVAVGCYGLRFASGFLNLKQHAPKAHRLVCLIIPAGIIAVLAACALQRQQDAVLVAFLFVLTFSVVMVWLGIITIRHGKVAGRYFLAAAFTAMMGTATTALAVWIGIPYSSITFHAAGWGMVIEGILLALALAHQVRRHQYARQQAEQLARIDPLTGLLNRRAFFEHALPVWSSSLRQERPLSVMMVDIDHFKRINDNHGHAMGDRALAAISSLLAGACRASDIAARWGGEEFVLLLPETDAPQATQLAERLRGEIESLELDAQRLPLALSASFGVATLDKHESLERLIRESDEWLYRAKTSGRNRVAGLRLQTER